MNFGRSNRYEIQKKTFIIVAVVITAIIITLISILVRGAIKPDESIVSDQRPNEMVENLTESETQDPNLNNARSRLTGLWVDKATVNNSPVAIMISNIVNAMPQSSLSSADIVFESLVEGGITRLCGLFENCTTLEKIGPVRSCRTYYLLFAKEFEATYVHFGYSEYAEKYLQNSIMHSLDGMVYCGFYRSTDRIAPHNAYTSWQGIMDSVATKGYPTTYPTNYEQPYTFNENDAKDITIADGQICLRFFPGYVNNNPYFSYNEIEKQYDRFQFGGAQIDAETGEQLKYKNILVKYVTGPYWPTGTPNYTVTGIGKGLYITDGKAVEVSWKNNSEYGSTKYYYTNGKEVVFNQGKTWICQIESANEESVKVLDSLN